MKKITSTLIGLFIIFIGVNIFIEKKKEVVSERVLVEQTTSGEIKEINNREQEPNQDIGETALPNETVSALYEALEDEYKAWATYDAAIQKFGEVKPFINIINAEQKHTDQLVSLFNSYGLTVPENNWIGDIALPDTLTELCDIGVTAEIDNAALYREKLIPAVSDYPDIVIVFTALMDASQNNHLPAFERCST